MGLRGITLKKEPEALKGDWKGFNSSDEALMVNDEVLKGYEDTLMGNVQSLRGDKETLKCDQMR